MPCDESMRGTFYLTPRFLLAGQRSNSPPCPTPLINDRLATNSRSRLSRKKSLGPEVGAPIASTAESLVFPEGALLAIVVVSCTGQQVAPGIRIKGGALMKTLAILMESGGVKDTRQRVFKE
jgi:hypothetical protein